MSIELVTKYAPILEQAFALKSTISDLIMPDSDLIFDGTNTIKFKKVDTAKIRDYIRDEGFIPSNVGVSWSTYKLKHERQINFVVDTMDDDETLGETAGQVLEKTYRFELVPELDMTTYATIASTAGVNTEEEDITDGETLTASIEKAEALQDDKGVPYEGRILYISTENYQKLRSSKAFNRFMNSTDTELNRNVTMFDDMKIVRVPNARFISAVEYETLSDGHKSTNGSVKKASDAVDLNFIVLHPLVAKFIMKYSKIRKFLPNENIKMDATEVQARLYYDTIVYEELADTIYVSKKTAE